MNADGTGVQLMASGAWWLSSPPAAQPPVAWQPRVLLNGWAAFGVASSAMLTYAYLWLLPALLHAMCFPAPCNLPAPGVRNTVGFDFHPATGTPFFTDNGRDREWGGAGCMPCRQSRPRRVHERRKQYTRARLLLPGSCPLQSITIATVCPVPSAWLACPHRRVEWS